MNARSLELFKALVEASFWFYTHPKDTSYRIIYNKSRYTMDKPRILKMLRLYLPFVRRLDDVALINYLYRNGGVVMAQMESGQLANLVSISENLPNTLQAAGEANPATMGESIDQAIEEEEKKQKEKEEQNQQNTRTLSPRKPPIADKTRLEDLATRAEKSGIVVANSSGVEITPRGVNRKIVLTQPTNLQGPLVVANKSGMVAPGPGALAATASPDRGSGVGLLVGANGQILNSSKQQPRVINPLTRGAIGPTKFERMVGGVMRQSSGAPVVGLGRNLASKSQVFVKRQGIDRLRSVVGGWLNAGGGGNRSIDYEVEDEEEEEFWGRYPNEPEEQKKGWSFLGLGLWWWLLIMFVLVLLFTSMSAEQEVNKNNDSSNSGGGGSSGAGGRKAVGGNCPSQAELEKNMKSGASCQYFNLGVNLTDTDISQTAIDTYINNYERTFIQSGVGDATEFKRRVNYIIQKSKQVGLNPVIFLGYWKSESLFSTVSSTTADLGCAPGQGRKSFEQEVNCAVGLAGDGVSPGGSVAARCASPSSPDKDSACKQVGFEIKTFDQFAENYGSKSVDINNCTHTYNILVEVAEELGACQASSGGDMGSDSCVGGWPVSGTIVQGPWGGSHAEYRGTGRVAVDIAASTGTPIYATFDGVIDDLSYVDTGPVDGRGIFVSVVPDASEVGGNKVAVRYLHFSKIAEGLRIGTEVVAGDLLGYVGMTGRADGPHLHMDFSNIEMIPPYVPQAILPVNCVDSSCQPRSITACKI